MANYPRPGDDSALRVRRENPALDRDLGLATAFLALPGLFSALEVLFVGEELSTLGARLLGNDHPWVVGIGMAAFAFSVLRLGTGLGWANHRRWGRKFGVVCAVLGIGFDAVCLSLQMGVLWAVLDGLVAWRGREGWKRSA